MEFLKDYDFDLQYDPGNTNSVADALSRKSSTILARLRAAKWSLIEQL